VLVRLLVKNGAEVKVIMTRSAQQFISALTLSTLSKNEVISDLVNEGENWNNHVALGLWANAFVVAPASANTIAKMANGLCDNALLAVYLSSRCPVFIAPAMDEDMWLHASTQKNIAALQSLGNKIIPVETGELASGLVGAGRMEEPGRIVQALNHFFSEYKKQDHKPLLGKKALVTAGPTQEAIDPVRYLSNHSSGKMGIAIAEALSENGADVELILGPTSLAPSSHHIRVKHVVSAEEMFKEAMISFKESDIAVMAAAVADYTPLEKFQNKIKKKNDSLSIQLKKTTDILKNLGEHKRKKQVLVGFALETDHELANAEKKLRNKNADFIVLNSLNDKGAGFQTDTNKITIIEHNGEKHSFGLKSKKEVAEDIVHFIEKYIS
jgi:phosphopantothenoylcysteine decarboxylase/phosphopantothenate--cysteine ligase